jgi:hypothetical protein
VSELVPRPLSTIPLRSAGGKPIPRKEATWVSTFTDDSLFMDSDIRRTAKHRLAQRHSRVAEEDCKAGEGGLCDKLVRLRRRLGGGEGFREDFIWVRVRFV